MMKKSIVSSLLVAGVAATACFLGKDENRVKVNQLLNEGRAKLLNETASDYKSYLYEKTGHPHEDDLEDQNMVDEGAVYAVQYYDEKYKQK
ncbi:hypothetical protein [Salisediminibacterium beveridgei]|uniref:Lipoprotein n=1 Tax=Salisediminibacterium beveridgei TaxID=632773 RepID=A0A1D7QWL2_9BACI|nr:hypothetical protein [Salisediminibacterium beveridgei]AOM83405.1 hypothetical protein BBEV_2045 [Salisediminibacterium beveridgei]AOM83419.1 hypothetical protein BBEV_2061 [Salisediminibacterium beveridgei]